MLHTAGRAGGARAAASDLAEHARRGDVGAFEDLVRATYGDVYALALRLTRNEEDACDVAQEAYLRAFRFIRRFRGDAAFSTWMYRITANCASNLTAERSRARHEPLDGPGTSVASERLVDEDPAHDPEARCCRITDREILSRALGALPDRLRLVVVLRDVYGLPHEAVADELGITITAARVRLHRARRQLRDELQEYRAKWACPSETPSRVEGVRGNEHVIEAADAV